MGPVDDKLILISLLVELGVAAAVAAGLARSNTFKRLLLMKHRTPRETVGLLAWICVPLTLGVLDTGEGAELSGGGSLV